MKVLAGQPFALLGVNSDQNVSIPQNLVEKGTVTWRSFQNDGGDTPISSDWSVRGWPTVVIMDAEGKIRYRGVRGKKIDAAIQTLLEEMDAEFPSDELEKEIKVQEEAEAERKAAERKAKQEAAKKAREAAEKKKEAEDKEKDKEDK